MGSLAAMAMPALAQQVATCQMSAGAVVVRSESLTERVGDIFVNCSGTAGATITFNLTVFLGINVTNRLTDQGTMDVLLSADTGSGFAPSGIIARYVSANSVVFPGITVTIPGSGRFSYKISNLRAAISQNGVGNEQPISAVASATIPLSPSQGFVAYPQRALLANYSSAGIRCTGSPLPSSITVPNLFAAKTRFFTTRVTEGFARAFEVKDATTDNGTRIVIRYSGFPATARLFTPEVVVGTNGTEPTSGGDMGLPQAAGKYTPGNPGSLLLALVQGADENGAGGTPVFTPPASSPTLPFVAAREVTLTSGSGVAVYEVVGTSSGAPQSAQIPTFLGMPPITDGTSVIAREDLSLGPISRVSGASTTAPIPRFVPVAPPSDCQYLGDCDAAYFPKLVVVASQVLDYAALVDSAPQYKYIQVQNGGGGILNWTASVAYKTGSGWITIDPQSGVNNGTVRIDVLPQKVQPGIWEATLTIDSGPSGLKTLPVKLEVKGLPEPPPKPKVIISKIANLARPVSSVVAPGSLAQITGTGFGGRSLGVAFDGIAGVVLSSAADHIEVQVPPGLGIKTSASLEVTVDGEKSAPVAVQLAEIAPAIFPNGVLNIDYTPNSETNPADIGGALIIYATGVIAPTPGPVQVNLHDRIFAPAWSGFAPGLIGVVQINILIPSDLPAMTTEVLVCGFASAQPDTPVCSVPVKITIKQPIQ